LSLAAAFVLARNGRLDRPTALLGMVAGGSAAVVAAADDEGVDADARVVAVLQYLRVVLVALTTPLVAAALAHGAKAHLPLPDHPGLPDDATGAAMVLAVAVAGIWLGRLVRLPAAALAGPLILATGLGWAGLLPDAPVPAAVAPVALAIIGLEIGMRFDVSTLRSLGEMAPAVATVTAVVIVSCALVGWLLSRATAIPLLEAYLMTTPGGINTVLAVSVGLPDVNLALVTLAQIARLLAMVIVMPVLVRRLAVRV
jgi:membrane AbrB-like protein